MNTTTTFGSRAKTAAKNTAAVLAGPVTSGLKAVGKGLTYGVIGGLTVFGVATGARLARKAYGEGGVGIGVGGSLGLSMNNDRPAGHEAGAAPEQLSFTG